ncbi:HIT domain-containing protein [uncultured Gimesia sp.]|mgnify:CR=1 FL=1|uniref:HIT domain-containing protein n=1 Tax=uncultured Gimesia sp. TaxID=1678688 RepID=UPI0030DCB6DB|tara:strand:+ start:24559 stop:24972 length:414 start_codon:yes stop_codon:yes gene_type:complete
MKLDDRLQADCTLISELGESTLLLMNNALVDWFILVPRCEEIELTNLPFEQQAAILKEVNLVARFIQQTLAPDKLNIATLGNVVSQLHIHVIGRKQSDPYWPAPVWGQAESQAYTDSEITVIKDAFDKFLPTQTTQI